MKIAVAGTGYVGLSLAVLLAQRNKVTAVDIVPEKVEAINNKKSPIVDAEIEEYLATKKLDLEATTDGDSAYKDAELVIVSTPTNYDEKKNYFNWRRMLRTSNARDFGLGDTLPYLENIQRISEIDDLLEREKKVDQLKWIWMEDESFFNYFTVERLFVFLLQLEMIERWISLDKDKGNELFRALIQGLKNDVQIPEEFRN